MSLFTMPTHIRQGTPEAREYFDTKLTKRESEFIERQVVDFDAFDRKGRRHGYRVVISKETLTRAAKGEGHYSLVDDENLGVWFEVSPHAMKDGASWGAISQRYRFRTLDEARAKADAILKKAEKAAAKKF